MDIRTVFTVGAIVLGGAVWISRQFQRFVDRLSAGNQRFTQIEQWMKSVDDRLMRMPCRGGIQPCPPEMAVHIPDINKDGLNEMSD